jgi:ABC-type nitrate/sulfonate/bicarbonate transport system substrate-binding protein
MRPQEENLMLRLLRVVGSVFFLMVCGTQIWAQDEVVFAVPGLIIPDLPIHYAVHGEFMKKAGLDAKILQAERRDLATLAVLSGDAIGSITDPTEAAIAFARGADLRVISGLAVNAPPFLVGDSSVSYDQSSWKGKTVALFTPPNTLYTLFMLELKKGAWQEVEKDVYKKDANDPPGLYLRISIGQRGTELAALLAGRANLAVLHEPDASTATIRGGKKKLHAFSEDFQQLLWSTLNTSGKAIRERPAVVSKIITAINATLANMRLQPDDVAAFAKTLFKNANPEVAESAVKSLLSVGIYPKNCMITEAGWRSNVSLLKLIDPSSKAADVPFDQIAETSFCERALKG